MFDAGEVEAALRQKPAKVVALRLVHEEGLEERFERHRANSALLWEGLTELGLELVVLAAHQLPTLTAVAVPEEVYEAAIRQRLLKEYNVDIAGGLGAFKGKAWRIGLMAYSSRREDVALLLSALAACWGGRPECRACTPVGIWLCFRPCYNQARPK